MTISPEDIAYHKSQFEIGRIVLIVNQEADQGYETVITRDPEGRADGEEESWDNRTLREIVAQDLAVLDGGFLNIRMARPSSDGSVRQVKCWHVQYMDEVELQSEPPHPPAASQRQAQHELLLPRANRGPTAAAASGGGRGKGTLPNFMQTWKSSGGAQSKELVGGAFARHAQCPQHNDRAEASGKDAGRHCRADRAN